MDSPAIVNTAIIAAGIGLFTLFVISLFAEPPEAKIGDLSAIEGEVTIKGIVTNVRSFESYALLEIAEVRGVTAVVFDKKLLEGRNVGQNITLTGRVHEYKGKKELIVDGIRG